MNLAEFKEAVGEIIGVEPSDLDSNTTPQVAPSWDSMAAVEIIALLEEMTDGDIEAEEADAFESFGAVLSFAEKRGIIDLQET